MVRKPTPDPELIAELKRRSVARDVYFNAMYEAMLESRKQYVRRLADE